MSATIDNSTSQPFVISRSFNAPRELVWRAWTERERLAKWFGPKGCTMPAATLDLRAGGGCHFCLRMPDGKEMWGNWTFREVAKPARLVWEHSFSDAAGGLTRHPLNSSWPLKLVTEVTLTESGSETTVTVQWTPLNATEAERSTFDTSHEGMHQGWNGTFEQLADYLAQSTS